MENVLLYYMYYLLFSSNVKRNNSIKL